MEYEQKTLLSLLQKSNTHKNVIKKFIKIQNPIRFHLQKKNEVKRKNKYMIFFQSVYFFM